MIRITFLLRRKPGMSIEDFHDYWLNRHAPLVASVMTELNILRYVQVHTLDTPANEAMAKARGGKMEAPYDGVAELWWESEETLTAGTATQSGQAAGAALLADEAKFIDLPQSPLWLACEYPQVNPTPENIIAVPRSNIVKLFYPVREKSGQSLAGAQAYWARQHGPLIRSHAPASGVMRYIQVHRVESPLEAALRNSRGVEVPPYMGHAELWFDRSRQPSPESRVASEAAVADEAKFIDFERCSLWLAKEHVIFDRRH